MTALDALRDDLHDEQQALDDIVGSLGVEDWRRSTPSPGWSVADQIGHLTYFDGTAALAIENPVAFRASIDELLGAGDRMEELTLFRGLTRDQLLDRWRANRRALLDGSSSLDESARVPWYGPDMGAKSFLTARLMECWAHGVDVCDAVGVTRPLTARLQHIARIGYLTRGWTYVNRGESPHVEEVFVELRGPHGATWAFGRDDASATVRGDAEQFCLVVTQRRHVDDTDLAVDGVAAHDWLRKAQAFAGPATDGPPKGTRP